MSEADFHDGGDRALVRFTFELGQLRAEARHGWLRIYENPESVAEHTQRAAALGFFLACREGFADPNRVVTMIVFHDVHETRVGDTDRVQKRYVRVDAERAALEQMQDLGTAGRAVFQMWKEVEEGSTEAGIIAKDAEILEMVVTARELVVRGNTDAQSWIDSSKARMRTAAGKALFELINDSAPSEWWRRVCE